MLSKTDAARLESQLESLNQQVARLMDEAGLLQEQLERLDHRASFGNDQLQTLIQHLSDVAGWTGPLDRRLAELMTWAQQSHEGMAQLEEGIRKLSRTQFKANSLAETQQERLQSALETLQDLATRKQEDIEQARQQQREAVETAHREARVSMVIDLFPALDGLESALESGQGLLRQSRTPATKPGFPTRLAYAFGLRDLPASSSDDHALAAWLDGLGLVRERFLALLRAEGIQPIRAEGQPFDPHLHVAVEAVERPGAPPGIVVEEHRPGYRLGDRVLRYAEVVVSRDEVVEEPGAEKPQEEEPEGWGHVEPTVEEPKEADLAEETETEPASEGLEETWGREEPAGEEPKEVDLTEEIETAPATEALEETWGREEPAVAGPKEADLTEEMETAPAPEALEGVWGRGEPVVEEPKEADLTEEMETAPAPEATEGAWECREPVAEEPEAVDPEIEDLIARFEARRRARQEQ